MAVGSTAGTGPAIERQTADGTAIRVYVHNLAPPTYPGGWSPPPGCVATQLIQVDLSDTRAVGIAQVGLFDRSGILTLVGVGVWGAAEAAPAGWVIVHTGTGVSRVSVSLTDGGTDTAEPVNGLAALSAPLDATTPPPGGGSNWQATGSGYGIGPGYGPVGGTVAAFDASGVQVATLSLASRPAIQSPGPACQPPSSPPPQLPPPGPQPADPAAAQAAVTKAFLTLYSRADQSVRFQYLQGADAAVAAAGAKAAANFSSLASATTPAVKGVVFTDQTHAAVLYEIDYQGHAVVGPKLGYAVLDAGIWKVTRASYCSDLQNGGGRC